MKDGFTLVYIIGAFSCWYHGTSFGVGLFWPWYIGGLFVRPIKQAGQRSRK